MRKLIALASVSLVLLVLSAVPVSAKQLPDLVCGEMPTSDVRLRQDLTCPTGWGDFEHAVPYTIDLGGHTLTADGRPCHFYERVTCGLSGFAGLKNGTFVGNASLIGTVDRVHFVGDLRQSVMQPGLGTYTITRSLVDGTVSLGWGTTTMRHNTIRGGIESGWLYGGLSIHMEQNVIFGWVSLRPSDSVSNQLGGVLTGNVVIGGSIYLTDDHTTLSAMTLTRNIVVNSAGDGIYYGRARYEAPGEHLVEYRSNILVNNAGHGINSTGPSIDRGGNIAIGNDLEPQCIGVSCRP